MIPLPLAFAAGILGCAIAAVAAITGVGGGFLYVPILTFFFGLEPTDAVGTSLIVIVFTTFAASVTYIRQGRVFFRSAICLLIPGMTGAMIGAYATGFIPGNLIEILFSAIVGFLSIKLLVPSFPLVRPITSGRFLRRYALTISR